MAKKPVGKKSVKKKSASKKTSATGRTGARYVETVGPRQQALELMAVATDCDDDDDYFAAVQRAVTVDPDFVEGWMELARSAKSRRLALENFERGIAAARRLHRGESPSVSRRGENFDFLFTQTLAEAGAYRATWGEWEEAIALFKEVWSVPYEDSAGVRFALASTLVQAGRPAEARRLCLEFPEKSSMHWSILALAEFATDGDSPAARAALKLLRSSNKHLVAILLGDSDVEDIEKAALKEIMEEGAMRSGGYAEGAVCHALCGRAWRTVGGAVNWLREQRLLARKSPHPAAVGPTPAAVERLGGLPQHEGTVWELGISRMPQWIVEGRSDVVRPWHVTLLDTTSGVCVDQDLRQREPDTAYLFDRILKGATRPLGGEPGKPAYLHVHRGSKVLDLREPLADAGIELHEQDELPTFDYSNAALRTAIVREAASPSLADMPGITDAHIRRFFEVSTELARMAPWIKVGESAIRVASTKLESGPWTMWLLGQGGMSRSLMLISDQDEMPDWTAPLDERVVEMERVSALQIDFVETLVLFPTDLVTYERLGLEPSAPENWPATARFRGGETERSLFAWEIELLEAICAALPEFLRECPVDDRQSAPWKRAVATSGGALPLELSWDQSSCAN